MADLLVEDQRALSQLDILVCLRLARQGQLEATARLRARAVALIKDVLLSKLDGEVEMLAPDLLQVHGTYDAETALAACRAVQAAFDGFCRASGEGAGVSILLDADRFGSPAAQSDLLRFAQPFQVLVTQSFYENFERLQPAALGAFRKQGNLCEFLWTGARKLAELQARNDWSDRNEPGDRSGASLVQESRPPVPVSLNEQTRLMLPDDALADEIPSPPTFAGLASEAENQAPKGKRRGFIIGICAVLLLGILGYFGAPYFLPGSQPKQPTVEQPKTEDLQPEPTPPANQARPVEPTPPPSNKPHPVAKDTVPKQRSSRPCETPQSVLPGLVELGNGSLSSGAFKDAIRQFTNVLACDPGNATAREGLERAKRGLAQQGPE